MPLGAAGALGYLITSHAVGQPSPRLAWPVWPYYVCGAIFAIGVVVYGAAHEMLPWQTRRALKRRAVTAESALEAVRADLDGARRELQAARGAAASSRPEAKVPPKTGLEVAIDREFQTPRPGVGRILEVEYHVTNHDPMEHQLFRHMEVNGGDGQNYFPSPDGPGDSGHLELIREAYRIEERRNREVPVPGRVRPGETVRGVYVLTIAWNPRRELPDYTLVISDGRREFRARPRGAPDSVER